MQIRIEASELPGLTCAPSTGRPGGYSNIHVGVQGRGHGELLGLTPADAATATWTLACTTRRRDDAIDVTGPQIQGRPGARFVYLSWVERHGDALAMFRRARLMLDGVPSDVLEHAVEAGALVGRLGLTDDKGHPRCASVRPPVIEWRAGAADAGS